MKSCCSDAPYYLHKEDNIITQCALKNCKKAVCPEHSECLNFFSPIDDCFFIVACDDCRPDLCKQVTALYLSLKNSSVTGFPRVWIIKKVIDLLSSILTPDFLLLNILIGSSLKECTNKIISYHADIMEKDQHLH